MKRHTPTHSTRSLATAIVVAALSLPAVAQSPATPAAAPGGERTMANRLAGADKDFLEQAAQNGHAEIEGSRLAATKATNPDVKAYAQKMVDAHTKSHQELVTLATSKGAKLPDDPSLVQKTKLKLLEAVDGEGFDRRYTESLGVEAHEDNVKLFQKASSRSADPEIKAFATRMLPELREHLTMARALKTASAKKGAKADAEVRR
jgi:putative membrane protein